MLMCPITDNYKYLKQLKDNNTDYFNSNPSLNSNYYIQINFQYLKLILNQLQL